MKAKALLVALMLAATPVLAEDCIDALQLIDLALQNVKQKSAAQLNEIKRLRVEGEKLHLESKHKEAVVPLAKAKAMLGIK